MGQDSEQPVSRQGVHRSICTGNLARLVTSTSDRLWLELFYDVISLLLVKPLFPMGHDSPIVCCMAFGVSHHRIGPSHQFLTLHANHSLQPMVHSSL